MSYCRWSFDDYKSDIYCYQAEDESYVIGIANNKYVSDTPRPILADENDIDAWLKHHYELLDWCEKAEMEPIGLPSDGKYYTFETIQETIDKLLQLREEGYHVPQIAIDNLKAEEEC